MNLINIALIWVLPFVIKNAVGQPPKFRILAPQFVCPKDKDAVIDKPDYTIITLQTEDGKEAQFQWTVRWYPLVAPTQQFTLELWRSVRELEEKLNDEQLESNVFIINNSELLSGVNYIFNVTVKTSENEAGTEQMFHIDNIKGDPKLLIEGRSDMFSIVLIGGLTTYADMDYVVEAQVTSCYRTNDYYFAWTVTSAEDNVVVRDVKGSQLEFRANTLMPGKSYYVLCQVFKYSNGDFITQNSLPFRVLHRPLSINFNVDVLQISVETPFSLTTDMNRLDYIGEGLTIAWECMFGGGTIDSLYKTDDDGTLYFPYGLADVGEYFMSLTVSVAGQRVIAQTVARIIVVEARLPVIKLVQNSRVLNEDSVTTLKANVTNMVPGCSINWYFESEVCSKSEYSTAAENCHETKHGNPISTPVNFYSLEESFLSELTDYTNETGWKSVFIDFPASNGRVRIVAECECDKENNCTNEGFVYADVKFEINEKPMPRSVLVTPGIGTAMETVFRLSTLPTADPNRPVKYSFYCVLSSNDSLLLGSYLEHQAVETFLPYIEGGTKVWVEVCDSLGACSQGLTSKIAIAPGEARTIDVLLDDMRAHVRRCELMVLRRLVAFAVVTYTNAKQTAALTKFTTALLNALESIEQNCIDKHYDRYYEFLYWLQSAGVDTTKLA